MIGPSSFRVEIEMAELAALIATQTKELKRVSAINAELLEACEAALRCLSDYVTEYENDPDWQTVQLVRRAVTKAKAV